MDSARQQGFWDGSPKVMFLMGLFLGVAISSTLGLGLVVGGLIKGGGSSAVAVNAGNTNNDNNGGDTEPAPAPKNYAPVKELGSGDHVKGGKNAKVTLIQYSDFECPYCKRFAPSLQQALKDFPNDVRVAYRHFPLRSVHANAQKAAEASECAAKIGGNDKFWAMHDKLIADSAMSTENMKRFAKEIGLDQGKFNNCLDKGETADRVNADFNEGSTFGVEGTPATFINGQLTGGAIPYDGPGGLKELIQRAGAQK